MLQTKTFGRPSSWKVEWELLLTTRSKPGKTVSRDYSGSCCNGDGTVWFPWTNHDKKRKTRKRSTSLKHRWLCWIFCSREAQGKRIEVRAITPVVSLIVLRGWSPSEKRKEKLVEYWGPSKLSQQNKNDNILQSVVVLLRGRRRAKAKQNRNVRRIPRVLLAIISLAKFWILNSL